MTAAALMFPPDSVFIILMKSFCYQTKHYIQTNPARCLQFPSILSSKTSIISPNLALLCFLVSSLVMSLVYYIGVEREMNLDRTVKWIDKTDGRDKFCKAIQYACRLLKHRFEMQGNKQAAKQFEALFGSMRDARKLFRLFKTLNEAKKISDLFSKEMTTESILNIGVRASFGIYWVFDNLNILSKIKLLDFDPKKMGKTGATFWLAALLLNLVLLIKTLLDNIKKVNETKKYSSMTDSEVKERRKALGTLLIKRRAILLNIVKVMGDVIPAGHGSQFFKNVLGFTVTDTSCGLGGLTSALITSYQLYE